MAGVGQKELQEVGRRTRGEDASLEAVLDEPRQVPAMVDVPVRQHDPVDRRRIDRQPLPVAEPQRLESLVEPAVHQDPLPSSLDQMLRARDRAGCPEEVERCHLCYLATVPLPLGQHGQT